MDFLFDKLILSRTNELLFRQALTYSWNFPSWTGAPGVIGCVIDDEPDGKQAILDQIEHELYWWCWDNLRNLHK